MAAQVLLVLGMPIYNVNAVSLRQTRVPTDLLGRVTASARFVMWGAMPIGAALDGLLGEYVRLRPAAGIACGGLWLASLIVVRSPVPAPRQISA